MGNPSKAQLRASFLDVMEHRVKSNIHMPAGRFFRPERSFWSALAEMPMLIKYVDAGAGSGALTKELRMHGYNAVAIDLATRDEQEEDVLQLDATQFPYRSDVWPLLCRPSHDGWCERAVTRAIDMGASVIYVGLPCNMNVDIGGYNRMIRKIWRKVGRDGESMYLISKEKPAWIV